MKILRFLSILCLSMAVADGDR